MLHSTKPYNAAYYRTRRRDHEPLDITTKELVNMAAKSIIPAGIIILACYSISIGYFPYKVSITDPIIITMTLCFGFVYFTYVTCMIFVCATIETITRKCLAPTLVRLVNKIKKKNLKLYNPPIKMEWYYHPVSALGALLIVITSELNITRLITLILVSFVFYALASMIVAVNEKCLTPIIIRPGETPESTISILNNLKFLRMILIIIFIGSPIFLFQTDVPKILLKKGNDRRPGQKRTIDCLRKTSPITKWGLRGSVWVQSGVFG